MSRRTHAAVVLVAMMLGAVAYAKSQSTVLFLHVRGRRMLRQFAYLKASNPAEDAHFGCGGSLTGHAGNSSALSLDGNTIAIGAPHENGDARGINGKPSDKPALQLRRGVRVHAQRRYRGAAGLHQSVKPRRRAPTSGPPSP